MSTYTLTAQFHIEGDFDEFLSYEENYHNLMLYVGRSLNSPATGINLIKVTEVEKD